MFTGSIVAIVTPMLADGAVDYPTLEALLEWHIASGTHGIVPAGTTGESATLNVEEHLQVIRTAVAIVNRRVPVIAGTGANSTTEAIELTAAAKAAGADGCLLVTPYYNKPPQEGLYRHYMAIADAVDIPQVLYNVPGRTACDLLPETIGRLAPHRNIVGIKEATGIVERVRQIHAAAGRDFVVLSGEDSRNVALMREGALGCISVTANVAPAQMSECCTAMLEGDTNRADAIDATLQPLHAMLFVEPNPMPVKWALEHMGRIGPGIRLPLVPFSEARRPAMAALLAEVLG
jgi:4-hydroxy-tetrahydrodipicolinate synthase